MVCRHVFLKGSSPLEEPSETWTFEILLQPSGAFLQREDVSTGLDSIPCVVLSVAVSGFLNDISSGGCRPCVNQVMSSLQITWHNFHLRSLVGISAPKKNIYPPPPPQIPRRHPAGPSPPPPSPLGDPPPPGIFKKKNGPRPFLAPRTPLSPPTRWKNRNIRNVYQGSITAIRDFTHIGFNHDTFDHWHRHWFWHCFERACFVDTL